MHLSSHSFMPHTPTIAGYQLFRLIRRPDQCCAVREGNDLPDFLDRNEWATAEVLEAGVRRPPGFQEDVALYACATQGFYMFAWSGKRQRRDQDNSTDLQPPSLTAEGPKRTGDGLPSLPRTLN